MPVGNVTSKFSGNLPETVKYWLGVRPIVPQLAVAVTPRLNAFEVLNILEYELKEELAFVRVLYGDLSK